MLLTGSPTYRMIAKLMNAVASNTMMVCAKRLKRNANGLGLAFRTSCRYFAIVIHFSSSTSSDRWSSDTPFLMPQDNAA